QVVDDLEADAEADAELVGGFLQRGAATADQGGALGAAGEQGTGLQGDLPLVALHGQLEVEAALVLQDLPFADLLDGGGAQGRELVEAQGGDEQAGVGEEKVAGDHRDPVVPAVVHRLQPASQGGLVDDVVMDQGGGVQ